MRHKGASKSIDDKKFAVFIFVLLLIYSLKSDGQVYVLGGMNESMMRNDHIIQNQEMLTSGHGGFGINYHPFRLLPKFSLHNEAMMWNKGYTQDIGDKYTIYLQYITFPMFLDYSPFDFLSIHTGVEPSFLWSTNIHKGTGTYNHHDWGLILGVGICEKKMFSFYFRFTYGLVNQLDYYSFDKLGNFIGEIHDLKNTCFSIGLKYNLSNEQIHLFP